MTQILITGVAGFAGSHLADSLLEDSTTYIVGFHHPSYAPQHLVQMDRLEVRYLDVLDREALGRAVAEIAPDCVYHLAGMANVGESWMNRVVTIETNFLGTLHLLESCRKLPKFPKVLLVGSGECYGIVPVEQQPIPETQPLVPSSPYSVSKISQEMLGIQYGKTEKLPVYLSRPFNHTGPRQKETFVCSAFARQIAQAEMGIISPEIHVGNLTAKRDFSDVRDVVTAYRAILEKGRQGDPYNVCSGNSVSIQEVLDILLSLASIKVRVFEDPKKFRPVDMPLLMGDPGKLRGETGWRPRFSIKETLLDLLNYWREKLKAGVPSE
jgi:GDP-4-dehydro-6-deoxy-D-mannose reductase